MDKKVVFIMGTAHCGSTLLDLILSSHSNGFSLGELQYIGDYIDMPTRKHTRICGVCVGKCGFWNDKVSMQTLRRNFSRKNYGALFRSNMNRYKENVYEYLIKMADATLLIDSSKGPEWIKQRIKPLYMWQQIDPLLIYLHRDGRAVCNSLLRKYPEKGMVFWAHEWKRLTNIRKKYYSKFPGKKKIEIQYEKLAENPMKTISNICEFLGISFEADMLQFWKHDHHPVDGGNLGTRSLIFKYREGEDQAIAQHWDTMNEKNEHYSREYYHKLGLAIKPDFRWREELTSDQLKAFDVIAGKDNVPYSDQEV